MEKKAGEDPRADVHEVYAHSVQCPCLHHDVDLPLRYSSLRELRPIHPPSSNVSAALGLAQVQDFRDSCTETHFCDFLVRRLSITCQTDTRVELPIRQSINRLPAPM